LAEPAGRQDDTYAVEALGAVRVAHRDVFNTVGLLPGVVAVYGYHDFYDELV